MKSSRQRTMRSSRLRRRTNRFGKYLSRLYRIVHAPHRQTKSCRADCYRRRRSEPAAPFRSTESVQSHFLPTGCGQKHAEPSSETISVVRPHNSPCEFRSGPGGGGPPGTMGLGEIGVPGPRSAPQPYPVRARESVRALTNTFTGTAAR